MLALHQLQEKEYKDSISDILYTIAEMRNKKDKQCIELCNAMFEKSCEAPYGKLHIALLIEMGLNQYTFNNDYKTGLGYTLQAYHMCEDQHENIILEVNALSTISLLYTLLGDLYTARNYYDITLSKINSIENPNDYIKRLLGNNYFNLVNLYIETEFNEIRFGYLDKAKKIFSEIGYKLGYARCLNMYSIIHPDYQNTELGLATCIEAEQIFSELHDKRGRGVTLCNIGYYYAMNNQFEKGIAYLNTSIELLNQVGQTKFIISGYLMRGISYSTNSYYEKAIDDFVKCETLLQEIESNKDKANLYQEWSNALEKAGRFEEANSILHKYIRIKIELDTFDKRSALSEERLANELKEREKETIFLRKKNEETQKYVTQLELMNNELKNYAHIASHDLKEPIRMVNLYMQKLESTIHETSSEQQEYFNYIKKGVNRMYELVDSVLKLSQIHITAEKKLIDLNELLHEVFITIQAKNSSIEIVKHIDTLPSLYIDRDLMYQAFQNILANAIKFNKNNPIVISVTYTSDDSMHEIKIADNGIGINEAYRSKVFEIFQRLEDKNVYDGTGIGLTIVKKIMDIHHGSVRIESNEPQGTIFILQFPR